MRWPRPAVPHVAEAERRADDLTFDIACVDGEPFPLFVNRQIDAVFPELTGSGHVVDSTFADEEMTALAVAAQRAIGVRYGVTHTRVRRTARGPKIVSVHWGLSGDLVPYAASIAMRRQPRPRPGAGRPRNSSRPDPRARPPRCRRPIPHRTSRYRTRPGSRGRDPAAVVRGRGRGVPRARSAIDRDGWRNSITPLRLQRCRRRHRRRVRTGPHRGREGVHATFEGRVSRWNHWHTRCPGPARCVRRTSTLSCVRAHRSRGSLCPAGGPPG